jgi:hypothetical protein
MSGAATSLTNTGALGIGANAIGGATANYADGKYAQVAVFSAILNQSTIQSYISQGLSGSETSLISAFSLNGNANDLNTTNANNLTASGGALATNADSPYANGVSTGTLEYAEVNSITYSTNTTINVRVPDTCMIPTSGGISNNYYSISQNPLNIPHISKIISSSQITYGFSTTSNTDAQVDGLRVTAYLEIYIMLLHLV